PNANVTDASNLITLNNTGVADASGNTGSGITSSNNYAIDTVRPTATITVANPNLAIGQTSLVTFAFSERVTNFDLSDISVGNGGLSGLSSSDSGLTWTATLTPDANITAANNFIVLDSGRVNDLAGNAGTTVALSSNYSIDNQRPTANISIANPNLATGQTSLVTFAFSEPVNNFTLADVSVANGTLSNLASSDGGATWTATLTPTANLTSTTNQISLNRAGVQDLSGNAGSGTATSNNYAIDTSRPTATIVLADNSLSIGETSQVTITFSEAVSGFTNADLTVVNGTLSTVTTSNNIVWTATFTPTNNITDSTNVITLDNTGVTDAAGNTGSGTTTSNNYAIDTQRPTANILVADASLTAGETSLVTITFSEAVSGFTNADLTVPNGTLSTVTSSDGGITWTATYTPNNNVNDTTNLISLNNAGVTDLAGNAGSGTSNSGNFTIDTVRPSATVVVADSTLSAGETSLVTITFSEAVTGFTNADLTVA
ncbi:Flagellar hook-length control protein fliK, partial [Pseudomonas amygdali pv. tabaci]